MSHGDDFHMRDQAVSEWEWIAGRKNVRTAAIACQRPSFRSLQNSPNCVVQRQEKSPRRKRTALGVPIPRFLGIQHGLRMPSRFIRSHGRGGPSPLTMGPSPRSGRPVPLPVS